MNDKGSMSITDS